MIRPMTETQLRFWRALCAPFHNSQLSTTRRGGRDLTYVDKRAIEIRLDEVCGPHGWFPEYEATQRGYKCRLSILVPMSDEAWVWMHKEDGAGFEEMGSYNKETKEWEADVDNDEKSGYTNALRRAAQDAWGIGRDLYKKGVPYWMFEDGKAPQPQAPARAPQAPPQSGGQPPSQPQGQPQGQGGYNNFKIPKAGKGFFAWAKEMEKTFETALINGMQRECGNRGWTTTFADLDQGQVNEIAIGVIGYIKTLPTYKGQFDDFATELPSDGGSPAPAPAKADPKVAPLRTELATKIKALIKRQTGRDPENGQIKEAFQNIAAEVANGQGQRGEAPHSLATLNDSVWIRNMIQFVDGQMSQSRAAGDQGDEDIPF